MGQREGSEIESTVLLCVLQVDPGLISSTHMKVYNHPLLQSQEMQDPLQAFMGTKQECGAKKGMQSGKTFIHICLKELSQLTFCLYQPFSRSWSSHFSRCSIISFPILQQQHKQLFLLCLHFFQSILIVSSFILGSSVLCSFKNISSVSIE